MLHALLSVLMLVQYTSSATRTTEGTLLRRNDPITRTIEQLVAAETLKVTPPPIPNQPNPDYDPANCILQGKSALQTVTEMGSRMIRLRNFKASHNCFKTALQSWYSGIQQRPAEFIGKVGPSQNDLDKALQQLKNQGLPESATEHASSSSSSTTTLNKMGEEDRPQIPPQLLYLHRLASLKEKARNVHVAQSKEKNIPPVEENNNMMIVPPRMVQERRHRRKKQGQEGKSATPLKAGAVVVPLSSQQLQTLSPQQQLHTLASAVRSSVMSHKSDGKNLQQFLGNFRL
jgi:hypothetical protein